MIKTRRQVLTEKYDELKNYSKQHAPELVTLFPEQLDMTDLLYTVHALCNDSFERGDYTSAIKKALDFHGVDVDVTPHMSFLNEQIHFILTFMKTQK